ncbi:MAG TPA: ATP-binding protein [Pyrinomonadaceae bacterium]|nr:ATP-binding protein [Pyrinomonadaceae bacterium]HMP65791.1 ATP-binding protein [Pyrinomonadaceae bacterium]
MGFLNTFRGRLLMILALMLVATLGVQYYLNLLMQQENDELRQLQTDALVLGMNLGFNSLTSETDRIGDMIAQPEKAYLDAPALERIRDILIIDNQWRISDSLDPEHLPVIDEEGKIAYRFLRDINDLPPLIKGERLGEDLAYFPNRKSEENKLADDEAHAVPIETSRGRWYVMVLLRNDRSEAAARAAQPLAVTLAVLTFSTLLTFWLVWRFTRPIANLSAAARRVAEGDLSVRVPDDLRSDEMGHLAAQFNEMTAELEKSKELEEQLQQAEKSAVIGRLGSAIAHEIRNPLNYINLTLDHLRSKFAPDGEEDQRTFKKHISQLKDEVGRINQQISDFLNYSRPASVNLRPTDARPVVEASLRIVEGLAEENNIKISVIEEEGVPQVVGDPEFLRSVFNNLFINAVQAMGNEGGNLTVKIASDPPGHFVRFEIADTGNGIPAENLSKIFEPYFSTKETGTGLGLAIVQKIVDVHNGTIEVESTEGEGTRFVVRLPRHQ